MSKVTNFGLVIHGGAGAIQKRKMTPELDAEFRERLQASLKAGYDILADDGSALDATQTAVKVMEDSELFNAGKGAVFTHDEKHEMDAAIIDGSNSKCGAVAGVGGVKNPIELARLVMEKSEHVLLARDGAEAFGHKCGVKYMPDEYFFAERRWKQLQVAKKWSAAKGGNVSEVSEGGRSDDSKHGTVGAVALDKAGKLAAATSTGGMTNVRFGRIGDTPMFGAGTYANNIVAVSTTGHGEYFMKALTAYDLAALMEYKSMSLIEAADTVIDKLEKIGGNGGLIAIDKNGNFAMPMNSHGMNRGVHMNGNMPWVGIFNDESVA